MKTDPQTHPAAQTQPTVLAVALSAEALSQIPRHVLAPASSVTRTCLADVAGLDFTGDEAPDLVLAPLTARGFDAMDLLLSLDARGYRGRILVLTPHLPDVALVRADVIAAAPGLNVDVIALDGSSALHLL